MTALQTLLTFFNKVRDKHKFPCDANEELRYQGLVMFYSDKRYIRERQI